MNPQGFISLFFLFTLISASKLNSRITNEYLVNFPFYVVPL